MTVETAHTTVAAVQAVVDRGATVAADGEEYGVRTQGDKCEWSTQVATDSGKDVKVEEVKKLGLTFGLFGVTRRQIGQRSYP